MIYAGFFRRAAALIIDILIIMLPMMFIFGPIFAVEVFSLGDDPTKMSEMQTRLIGVTLLGWQTLSLVALWLYFAFLESGPKQATWGKRLLGIKVVGTNGKRISFARASGRFVAKILSYLIFYIGFIMAGFTSRKRALHDIIAETYVVKKDYREGQELAQTKSYLLALVLVCAAWMLFLIGSFFVSAVLSMTPTQQVAQDAAARMEQLSRNGTRLNEPMRLDTMTLFYTPDGYRAVVTDPASGNKFTLFLQNGTNQACCQSFPFGDCEETGLETCK